MEGKKLLIVGIDPGTTTAYAVLDIEGNLLHLASSKQLSLNQMISDTLKLGKVVLVGTDKGKIPHLAAAFGAKFGARIVNPEQDLKVDEKRKIVSSFDFDNEHQADALASALFAYRSEKSLLDKIDFFAEKNKKHGIKNRIKDIVVTKRISIKNAVSIIERKDDESQIIGKVIYEKKLNESDFLRLFNKLKKYESEKKLIRSYNDNLKKRLRNLEKQAKTEEPEHKKPVDFRENRIIFLDNLVKSKEAEIERLRSSIGRYNKLISGINDFCILKKLDTLGINEFNFKNKALNIQRNDMLLVENPNIVSDSVVAALKNRVFVIVHKKPISKNIENRLPFVFIDAARLKIEEHGYFGFIERANFEVEKRKANWVNKIIEDYKREKEQLA